jgi:hypothetical protein
MISFALSSSLRHPSEGWDLLHWVPVYAGMTGKGTGMTREPNRHIVILDSDPGSSKKIINDE